MSACQSVLQYGVGAAKSAVADTDCLGGVCVIAMHRHVRTRAASTPRGADFLACQEVRPQGG